MPTLALPFAVLPEIAQPATQSIASPEVSVELLAVQPVIRVLFPPLMPIPFASACTFLTMPEGPT